MTSTSPHGIDLPTRERILRAARQLFQQRGYYAVGTAEILDESRAPKGSMYHHFPGGKEQIAIEVVNSIRADVLGLLRKLDADGRSVADTMRQLALGMARWLENSDYREGSMLASTTIGSVPDLPKLHAAIRAAFDDWRSHIAARLSLDGWTKKEAATLAQTLIAGIEGAMILARIDRDKKVVVKTVENLARLLDTAPRFSPVKRRRSRD
jgi:TetR/AcrR family transcriptional regulator, lmrAB and yxaGH operons repressor